MRRLINFCIQCLRPVRKTLFPNFEISRSEIFGSLWKVLFSSSRLTYVDNVVGHRMFLDDRDSLGLSFYRIHEPAETAFFQRLVKRGDVVVDVGANIGYYTLIFARQVGENGRVYAAEPAPENFEILKKNVKINNYENVILLNKAVSSRAGTARLYLNEENGGDHRLYAASSQRQSVEVEMVKLDDVLLPEVVPRVDVVKMDIQGAEYFALLGMEQLLKRSSNVVLVMEFWPHGLHNAGVKAADLLAMLRTWGFGIYTHGKEGVCVVPVDEQALMSECTVENERHSDLICVRGSQSMRKLCDT